LKGGDWVFFHQQAVALAESIRQRGWQVWDLRPGGNAPIGIAAAAYFITGINEPWVLLPINSALFGLAAVSLHGVLKDLAPGRLAFVAVLPFIFSPSAAMIYGQIHKDVFSIAGVLTVIFVWTQIARRVEINRRIVFGQALLVALACFLVWVVRPYLLQPLIAASLLVALLLAATSRERTMVWWADISLCLLIPIVFLNVPATLTSTSTSTVASSNYIERLVVRMNESRAGFTDGYRQASSNIDTDVRFNSLSDIAAYIPRALQVGLFAPFPSMWIGEGVSPGSGVMRFIAGLEVGGSYALLIGVCLLFFVVRGHQLTPLLVAIAMATIMVLALSLVVCNVGTLYRMRYGSWQLLNSLGIIGWGLLWVTRLDTKGHK